jgi:hypothetical protein
MRERLTAVPAGPDGLLLRFCCVHYKISISQPFVFHGIDDTVNLWNYIEINPWSILIEKTIKLIVYLCALFPVHGSSSFFKELINVFILVIVIPAF